MLVGIDGDFGERESRALGGHLPHRRPCLVAMALVQEGESRRRRFRSYCWRHQEASGRLRCRRRMAPERVLGMSAMRII